MWHSRDWVTHAEQETKAHAEELSLSPFSSFVVIGLIKVLCGLHYKSRIADLFELCLLPLDGLFMV